VARVSCQSSVASRQKAIETMQRSRHVVIAGTNPRDTPGDGHTTRTSPSSRQHAGDADPTTVEPASRKTDD
jgi:hypothetical protein